MALSRKPFGIGHMFISSFLLRMTDTMTYQNIYLSSWDTLCMYITKQNDNIVLIWQNVEAV
jgi:hypothetical protein